MAARLAAVCNRVSEAASRVGRDPASVEILPVTKGHPAPLIREAAALGLGCIGENRVSEAEAKFGALEGKLDVEWCLIGRLQRNKARRAVRLFDSIESVDSMRLAQTLSRIALEETTETCPVLVQVNASGEATKAGFGPAEAVDAVLEICELPGLRVDGLMTMAPFGSDEHELRGVFASTRGILEECGRQDPRFKGGTLSMGMSNDFEIAVEEGSTRVRLGSVLVGPRPAGRA